MSGVSLGAENKRGISRAACQTKRTEEARYLEVASFLAPFRCSFTDRSLQREAMVGIGVAAQTMEGNPKKHTPSRDVVPRTIQDPSN